MQLTSILKNKFNKSLGKSQRYAAFTLAEVLITITIVGIIASLIIPQLINSSDKTKNIAIFKQDYEILSNAIASLNGEYHDTATNTFYNDMMYSSNLYSLSNGLEFPMLVLSTYLPTGTTYCFGHGPGYKAPGLNQAMAQNNSTINGICWDNNNTINELKGTGAFPNGGGAGFFNANMPAAVLPNGSFIRFIGTSLNNVIVYIDTDGIKGKDTFGKDIFVLAIVPSSANNNSARIKPFDANPNIGSNVHGANPDTTCIENSTVASNTGLGCAMKIILGAY